MAASVEDIVNQSLRRLGNKTPIGWIYEGSDAARAALELYGQTRDDLLASEDWSFARQVQGLTLLKTAPVGGYAGVPWTTAFPQLPWVYEYAYPPTCLTLRALRPTPLLIPEYLPKAHVFVLGNDPAEASGKCILTNLANAIAVFTEQVTDVTQYEPMFIEALVEALARRLGEALGATTDAIKTQYQVEREAAKEAAANRG